MTIFVIVMSNRINIGKIADQYGMDKSSIMRVLGIFLVSTSEDCEALRQALDLKKTEEIKRFSHKLKSSYSYIISEESIDICNKIKAEIDSTNIIENVESLVFRLLKIHKELVEEISLARNEG